VLVRVFFLVVVLLEVALEEVCGAGAANKLLLTINDSAKANIFFILVSPGKSSTRSQSRGNFDEVYRSLGTPDAMNDLLTTDECSLNIR
jgi:hypothetical protein